MGSYLGKLLQKRLVLDSELVLLRHELPLERLVVPEQVLNLGRLARLLDHLLSFGQLLLKNCGLSGCLAESCRRKRRQA